MMDGEPIWRNGTTDISYRMMVQHAGLDNDQLV